MPASLSKGKLKKMAKQAFTAAEKQRLSKLREAATQRDLLEKVSEPTPNPNSCYRGSCSQQSGTSRSLASPQH